MKCPDCGSKMQSKELKVNPATATMRAGSGTLDFGLTLRLLVCPRCGGIWIPGEERAKTGYVPLYLLET